jgi:bacteriocin-like protein
MKVLDKSEMKSIKGGLRSEIYCFNVDDCTVCISYLTGEVLMYCEVLPYIPD